MERTAVHRTVDLDCSAAALWRLVSESGGLANWLGTDVSIDRRPGGAGQLVDDDGVVRRLSVREVDEGHRLAFTWWPEGDEGAGSDVVFTVEEIEGGSRLTITESAEHVLTGSWEARVVSLWLAVCSPALV